MAVDAFYESSFGGVRIWCSRISTVNGRRLVVHDPSSGDEHPVQDRGLETRIATASLLFDEMEGTTDTPKQRFDRFCELVELGEPQIFTHPLRGSYLARVGRFDHEIDEYSCISAEVEFVPEDRVPPVSVASDGTSAAAGEDSVIGAADLADVELEAIGISTPVTSKARTAAAAWSELDVTARRVLVDVAQTTEEIATEIDRLQLEASLDHWRAYRAMLLLSEAIVNAGRAATSDVARVMTVRVGRAISLRAFLASVFGARDVDVRYRQALSLNDIRTPAWLEPGIELRLPLITTQPRRG